MFANPKCRQLPVALLHKAPIPCDQIETAARALNELYRQLLGLVRIAAPHNLYIPRSLARADMPMAYAPGFADPLAVRVLLLRENLDFAAAEIAYTGRCDTLRKMRDSAHSIAAQADIELNMDFGLPDLEGEALDLLPDILGAGQEASDHDAINTARTWLDGLYDDARCSSRALRVEIVLLWHSLPRAEAELDYLGRSLTLDRLRLTAKDLARRLRTELVDQEAEVAEPATRHRELEHA